VLVFVRLRGFSPVLVMQKLDLDRPDLSPKTSVADPDPGTSAFLTPGSGIGFFRIESCGYQKRYNNNKFFTPLFCCCFWIRIRDLVSGIRNGLKSGSGTNIPYPQHCRKLTGNQIQVLNMQLTRFCFQ
jgi:hypothetical protein